MGALRGQRDPPQRARGHVVGGELEPERLCERADRLRRTVLREERPQDLGEPRGLRRARTNEGDDDAGDDAALVLGADPNRMTLDHEREDDGSVERSFRERPLGERRRCVAELLHRTARQDELGDRVAAGVVEDARACERRRTDLDERLADLGDRDRLPPRRIVLAEIGGARHTRACLLEEAADLALRVQAPSGDLPYPRRVGVELCFRREQPRAQLRQLPSRRPIRILRVGRELQQLDDAGERAAEERERFAPLRRCELPRRRANEGQESIEPAKNAAGSRISDGCASPSSWRE